MELGREAQTNGAPAVPGTVVLNDEEMYKEHVKKGRETLEKKPLTLEGAIETHLDVYKRLSG